MTGTNSKVAVLETENFQCTQYLQTVGASYCKSHAVVPLEQAWQAGVVWGMWMMHVGLVRGPFSSYGGPFTIKNIELASPKV